MAYRDANCGSAGTPLEIGLTQGRPSDVLVLF